MSKELKDLNFLLSDFKEKRLDDKKKSVFKLDYSFSSSEEDEQPCCNDKADSNLAVSNCSPHVLSEQLASLAISPNEICKQNLQSKQEAICSGSLSEKKVFKDGNNLAHRNGNRTVESTASISDELDSLLHSARSERCKSTAGNRKLVQCNLVFSESSDDERNDVPQDIEKNVQVKKSFLQSFLANTSSSEEEREKPTTPPQPLVCVTEASESDEDCESPEASVRQKSSTSYSDSYQVSPNELLGAHGGANVSHNSSRSFVGDGAFAAENEASVRDVSLQVSMIDQSGSSTSAEHSLVTHEISASAVQEHQDDSSSTSHSKPEREAKLSTKKAQSVVKQQSSTPRRLSLSDSDEDLAAVLGRRREVSPKVTRLHNNLQ